MSSPDTTLPGAVPVMVLGGATLFPRGYMPLFIFEPRYRAMLDYALERDRMFCIGHARPGINPDLSADPVFPITTVGLIRACVSHRDGTSHLMLCGVQRVEILDWGQVAPFRIATILPRPCRPGDPAAAAGAALELVDLCERIRGKGLPDSSQFREHLRCVKDPAVVADLVSQSFVADPTDRQRLLEMDGLDERLDFLVGHLSAMIAGG